MNEIFDKYDEFDTIISKLSDILKTEFAIVQEIDKDTDIFLDLKMDSVDAFSLIVSVETSFGIEFDDISLLEENFSNIGDFVSIIRKQIQKGN